VQGGALKGYFFSVKDNRAVELLGLCQGLVLGGADGRSQGLITVSGMASGPGYSVAEKRIGIVKPTFSSCTNVCN
jgi:hypothetical protein